MVQIVGTFNTTDIEAGVRRVNQLLGQLEGSAQAATDDLEDVGQEGADAFDEIDRGATGARTGVKGLFADVGSLQNLLLGLGTGAVTKAIIDTSIQFERFERVLGLVAEGADGVAGEFQFIREEAERLGQPIGTLADKYAQLATAAEGTALEGDAIRDVFSGLIEVTSLLGSETADVDGALLGLTQILSRGVTSTEDLRQITDRLPGTLRAAQLAAGDMGGELSDMLEDGELISEQFLPLFITRLREAFGTDATSRIEGLRQTLGRLGNDFFNLRVAIGEGGFTEGLTEALESFREVVQSPELTSALATIGDLAGSALVLLADNLDVIATGFATLISIRLAAFFVVAAQGAAAFVTAAITGNPFGLLLRAVTLLGPPLLALSGITIPDVIDAFTEGGRIILGIWSGLAEAIPAALDVIPAVIGQTFDDAVQFAATALQGLINTVIEFVNSIGSIIGVELDPVNIIPVQTRTEYRSAGEEIAEAFTRGFEEGYGTNPPDEVVADSAESIARSSTAIERAIEGAADAAEDFGDTAVDATRDVVDEIEAATEAQERLTGAASASAVEFEIASGSIGSSFTGLGSTIENVFEIGTTAGSSFTSSLVEGFVTIEDTGTETFETVGADVEDFVEGSSTAIEGLFELATGALETFGIDLEDIIGTQGVAIIETFSNITQEQWTSIVSAGQVVLDYFGIDFGQVVQVAGGLFSSFSGSIGTITQTTIAGITSLWSGFGGFFTGLAGTVASVWQGSNTSMSGASQTTTSFISGLWTSFSGLFASISGGLTSVFSSFTSSSGSNFAGFIGGAIAGIQQFGGVFQSVISSLSSAFGAFVSAASSAISGVVSAAGSAASSIVSTISSAVQLGASVAGDVLGSIFATGGVVQPFATGGAVSSRSPARSMLAFQEGARVLRRPEAFSLVDGTGRRTIGLRGEQGRAEAILPLEPGPRGEGIIAQLPRQEASVQRQGPEVLVINAPRADLARMEEIERMIDEIDASIEARAGALVDETFRQVR